MPSFDYVSATLGDLHVVTETGGSKRNRVKEVLLKGEAMQSSDRFFQSLYSRYGFNKQIFNYFDHKEVLDRITDRSKSDKVVCCVERKEDGTAKLLATSNPQKSVVKYDDLLEILDKNSGDKGPDFDYHGGVVRSTHTPKFTTPWTVGGDAFSNRFVMDTPIDGYSSPSIYLMTLREICTNGAVAQTPVFRSKLALGKGEDNFDYAINRALEGFNNEEGFLALQSRLEMAQHSWASISETQKLYKHLVRLHSRGLAKVDAKYLTDAISGADGDKLLEGSPLLKSFNTMVGDITKVYGLANLDALSNKRQRTLPAPCKVYDLLNFATEVASHHTDAEGARYMQSYVGSLIGSGEDYDLEGTCEKFSDFRDFLVLDAAAIESKMVLDNLN